MRVDADEDQLGLVLPRDARYRRRGAAALRSDAEVRRLPHGLVQPLPNRRKLLLPPELLPGVVVTRSEERGGERQRPDDGEHVCVDAVAAREQLRHSQRPFQGTRILCRDEERADEGAPSHRNSARGAHGR